VGLIDRKALLGLIILLGISFTLAVGQVDLVSVTTASGDPGSSVALSLSVNNAQQNTTISQVDFTSSNLTKGNYIINAPTISSVYNLINNTPQTANFNVVIPQYQAPGVYTGVITASENGNPPNSDTINYQITINQKKEMSTSPSDKIVIKGYRGANSSAVLTITNLGNVDLNNIQITPNITLNDNDDDAISLSLSQSLIPVIQPGNSTGVTLTVNINDNVDLGVYNGIINLTESDVSKAVGFEIDNFPKVCSDGEQGNYFSVSINEPDSGDEFFADDNVTIEARVENSNDDDGDVIVEAKLYDMDDGKIIKSAKSKVVNIDGDSSEDIDLTLNIPYKYNEGHNFILFVKAYEEGNEDDQCKETNIDLNLKRKDHEVIISELTFSPSTVKCGETVGVVADVQNAGTSDEDNVRVRLKESDLDIDELSNAFNLGDYGSSDDDETVRFDLLIPLDTENRNYFFEAITEFNDGEDTNSKFFNVNVACEGSADAVTITLGQSSTTASPGGSFAIPITITNNVNNAQTYVIEFVAAGGWTNTISQAVSLSSKETKTIYLYPVVNANTLSGLHTGTVYIKLGEKTFASKAFSVDIKGSEVSATGFSVADWFNKLTGDNLSMSFFIIGDIVFIILAIYLIRKFILQRKSI